MICMSFRTRMVYFHEAFLEYFAFSFVTSYSSASTFNLYSEAVSSAILTFLVRALIVSSDSDSNIVSALMLIVS